MAYEPLHHKYRPQTLAELVGQEAITTTLTNALQQQKIAPAYLFTGARGTGKTSSARILAKSLNCLQSNRPTAAPCGQCEVCRSITKGAALDVIEIDAASNTGVDNIRELIERAQFAPVQCRYKVYVIDECLTGDSLVLTRDGWMRIDDRALVGRQVLSYSEQSETWEFKRVKRWFDQGVRQTYVVKTSQQEIRCTGNHLIRTEQGWVKAADLKPGMQIFSPQIRTDWPVDAASWNPYAPSAAAAVVKNSKSPRLRAESALPIFSVTGNSIQTDRIITKCLPWQSDGQHWNPYAPSVAAAAASGWKFPVTCSTEPSQRVLPESKGIGIDIPIGKGTAFGSVERCTISKTLNLLTRKIWDVSMARCWGMEPSPIQTAPAGSQGYLGHMAYRKEPGWSIKRAGWTCFAPACELPPIRAMENFQSAVARPVTRSSVKSSALSDPMEQRSESPQNGWRRLHPQAWPGGIWMTALSDSPRKAVHRSDCILRGIQLRKISSWQHGSQSLATPPRSKLTPASSLATSISPWEQPAPDLGWPTSANTASPQWRTNLVKVESVRLAGAEPVYDIEVEDNHNFVANGLLVHNCHMLSTQAFNALLKTLEEPPDRVVFVLATTDPQRVLPTIISRCQRFDFRRIELGAMTRHLIKIADQEAIDISPEAVQLVGQLAQGGLRDAQSTLDQLSLLEGKILPERVWDLVGAVPERDLLALVQRIAAGDSTGVIDGLRTLMDRGREPLILLQNLASFYRDLLIAKTTPERRDLVAITAATWAEMVSFAQNLSVSSLLKGQQQLRASELQIKNTTQPRLWLEVTLLGLLAPESSAASIQPVLPSVAQSASRSASPPASPPISPLKPAPMPAPQPAPTVSEPVQQPAAPVEPPISAAPPPAFPLNPPAAPAAPAVANLEQVWQSILGLIQPPGTRELFKQQGRLLALAPEMARVGITSQPLFKMAQMRVTNLETAFAQHVDRPIKVSLEVVAALTDSPASNLEISSGERPSPLPSSKTVLEAPTAYKSEPPQPSPATPQQPPAASNPAASNPASPPAAPAWQAEDEVSRAAKSFAQMFNGQIVSNSDPEPTASDAAALELAIEPEPEAGDPDDDVPF